MPFCRFRTEVRLFALAAGILLLGTAAAAQTFSEAFTLGIELGLGAVVDRQLQEMFGPVVTLPDGQRPWVEAIFRDLVRQVTRREIRYSLKVIDAEDINAFSAPDGTVYLTTGLLRHLGGDTDALANVLAHELAHIERRHGLETFLQTLRLATFRRSSYDEAIQRYIEEHGVQFVLVGWGREMEHEADALGQQIAAAAGYDPYGLVRFFDILRLYDPEEPAGTLEDNTHPHLGERTARARVRARELPVAERRTPKPQPPEEP